jgi:hypothetical protein
MAVGAISALINIPKGAFPEAGNALEVAAER